VTPAALFEPAGAGFLAASLTRGPWDEHMMHGGAPAALLAHTIEQTEPGAARFAVAKLTVELLGGVPVGPVEVATWMSRSNTHSQVIGATLKVDGPSRSLTVGCGHAVRLLPPAMPEPASLPPWLRDAFPPPESGRPWSEFARGDELFYPGATEIRVVRAATASEHAIAWIRLRGELLPGVAPSPLVRACAAADFSNGLTSMRPLERCLFVDSTLTVYLRREPQGEWIGVDAQTVSHAGGGGLTTATLHDQQGRFGRCEQLLVVRPPP